MMLNLDELESERENACVDKAELFDFYHKNWGKVVDALRAMQDAKRQREELAATIMKQGTDNIKDAYRD